MNIKKDDFSADVNTPKKKKGEEKKKGRIEQSAFISALTSVRNFP